MTSKIRLDYLITFVEVVDVFKGEQIPAGRKSITFRVEFLEHEEGDEIERLLKGLGGEQR